MDDELLKFVFEELEFITNEWNAKDVSDSNLRRSSTALRSLLVEGKLFTAAHLLGINKLRVLTSGEEKPAFPDPVLHQAGGGKHKGMQVKQVSLYDRILSPEEIKAAYKAGKGKKKPIKLSVFMKSPSIIIQGTDINKVEVIKYICNKLGGAHYDTKRGNPTKNGKVTLEGKYTLLDGYKKEYKLAGKNAVYFELLSIGQKLINNKDVQKLKKKIKDHLSEH